MFKSKIKISINDFCCQFYDSQIFREDGVSTFWQSALSSIIEADPSLEKVDYDLFQREIIALQMELFGLIWTQIYKWKEKFLWPQITFTKTYLEQNGHQNIWDIMAVYNKEISQQRNNNIIYKTPSQRSLRGKIAFYDSMMFDLYKLWEKKGLDLECGARIINRAWSEEVWTQGFVLKGVGNTLINRLGWKTDSRDIVISHIIDALSEYCNSINQAIKSVKITNRLEHI